MSIADSKKIRNAIIIGVLIQAIVGIFIVIGTNKASSIDLKGRVITLEKQSETFAHQNDVNTIYSVLIKKDESNRQECKELIEYFIKEKEKSNKNYIDLMKSMDSNFKFLVDKIDDIN